MEFNADFSKRAVVHAARIDWVPSPMPGVERRMLDRIGGEVARATSIVRYAPGRQFSPHVHGGGEEFLVLEGVFSDEHGDYPTGTYVRNPPTTSHSPSSRPGCVIFVKLQQFDPHDRKQSRVDTHEIATVHDENRPGVVIVPLYQDEREMVRLERWSPRTTIKLALPGGGEFLVLDGDFEEGRERFERLSWQRLPMGTTLEATAGPAGCEVWAKSGHLRYAPQP